MDSRNMKRNACTSRVVFRFAGITLLVFGAVLAIFWPTIFDKLLAAQLALGPKSKSFEQWKSPSVPLYLDVYFFNWTNPEEFLDETKKPIMKEVGPYRFREIRDKRNITFNDHNSTVSYRTFNTFHFDEDASNGTLDDVITQLNIVAIGASAQALHMDYVDKKYVSLGLNSYDQTLDTSKTARELLFEGYEDDMVLMGREGILQGFESFKNIPYDRIGWFYLRNATNKLSGTYNVHTGKSDITKLGTIQKFNYLDHNRHYTDECSKVFGSTGELFAPLRSRDSIELFTPDMCRTIPFDYEKDVTVHGITGYRYSVGDRALDNGVKFRENSCFNGDDGEPVPSGVMNISACRYGSPVFMSLPHYLGADSFYLNEVDGLEPNKEKHESYFTLEPLTGAPLEVTIRFQANFLVRPIEELSRFQEVPRIFMPAMWFEQKFVMDPEMARQIRVAVEIPLIGRIAGFVLLVTGFVFIIISCFIALIQSRRKSHRHQINLGEKRLGEKISPLLARKVRPQIMRQQRQQQREVES